jgi:KDEL-tailed cysteine endopeptidase
MESFWHIATGTMVTLSEQQFVDCETTSYGCNGGWMNPVFTYAASHGLATGADYPYTGRDGVCYDDTITPIAGLSTNGYVNVSRYNPLALQTAIRNEGPVTIAVMAGNQAFMYYSSGVISSGCGTSIDHAILAVGYGNDGA